MLYAAKAFFMVFDRSYIRVEEFVRFLGTLVLIALLASCSRLHQAEGDPVAGKALFDSTCDACHYANSRASRAGPGLAGFYKKKAMANGISINDNHVERWIRDGNHLMPGYKNMLSDKQMRNLIAYLKTL